LSRNDDPDRVEFARIPSAILYHDKEKLLDGAMVLRKVELHRPRLRVERNPDGSWNLRGLAATPQLDVALPTIVVDQGTVTFQANVENGAGLSLELTDVNLTLINDPISIIHFEGSAFSAVAGKVHLSGQLQRGSNDLTVSIKAPEVPLNAGWSDRIVYPSLAEKLQGLVLEGKGEVKADLTLRPTASPAFSYDVRFGVRDARLRHPLLPLPLEKLEAVVRIAAGEMRLEKLKAESGAARVEASGFAQLPSPEQSWEGSLDIRHLKVTEELVARLPEKLRKMQDLFEARGLAAVHVHAAFKDGAWTRLANGEPSVASILPENMSACFEKFRYPLERIRGSVRQDLLSHKTEVDITAYASNCPIFIKGSWHGVADQARCGFDIVAGNIPIDPLLISALPPTQQTRIAAFNPSGQVDVKYHLRRDPGGDFSHEYHLRVHDARMRWNDFPYALEDVSGIVDGYRDHWEFRDFQGMHKNGGKLTLQGRAVPRKEGGNALVLELSGQQVALDDDLKRALASIPGLGKAWDALRPRGRADFAATIDRTAVLLEDMDVKLVFQGCTAVPAFFPYTFDNCGGKIRYHRNRVEIERFHARRRDTEIAIVDGALDINPGGGYFADLADIRFRKVQCDDEFTAALPPALQGAVRSLNVQGTLAGKTRLVIAQLAESGSLPDLFWDGQIWFNDLAFTPGLEVSQAMGTLACRGRYNGRQLLGVNGNLILDSAQLLKQPLKNVHAGLLVAEDRPQVLLVNLKAPLHGGDITGQVRLEFASTLRYDLNLTANQVDLQRLGRQLMGKKSQISGAANGRLVLSGQGTNLNSLQGSGSIDVPSGRLLNLPLLLDLLKFLGLHWPDRTAFEEVHAQFAIHGRRVSVSRLELLGSAVSLYGNGEFNLDGTELELDFYPSWARVEQILPPAIRSVPSSITRNLLIIEMRGKVGSEPDDLKFHKKPLPLLFEPLMYMRDRLGGQPIVGAAPPPISRTPIPVKKE